MQVIVINLRVAMSNEGAVRWINCVNKDVISCKTMRKCVHNVSRYGWRRSSYGRMSHSLSARKSSLRFPVAF
ncbi:hypothetical protein PILCRDRAFT_577081 [Piloderma croceum F 1598]|uniref:Uncharacterized protein n=1 Tax=Piloderma croceum (strain F 1598) TaxID=765440 RepID=A0A0C3FG91_PILCF|nr:hypothetical protein PILCRDRAFT_577081 [Piloderma croceum F 1598]